MEPTHKLIMDKVRGIARDRVRGIRRDIDRSGVSVLQCIGRGIVGAVLGLLCVGLLSCPLAILFAIFPVGDRFENVFVVFLLAAGVIAGTIYMIMNPIWEEMERLRREEAAQKAEEEARLRRYREDQDHYRGQMSALGEESIGLFELMPRYLSSAEEHLDKAEVDFADRAFAPFWDSIERAAKTLALFDKAAREIEVCSSSYTELSKKYEDTPPHFPLSRESVVKLRVATSTTERMKGIVRRAQRNFQFATIYEQRKTNKILVAGFTNLAHALEQMTSEIAASIEQLAVSLEGMTSSLDDSMRAIHSRVDDIAGISRQHHGELMNAASEMAAREAKALEMLDDIQRRMPSSLHRGHR